MEGGGEKEGGGGGGGVSRLGQGGGGGRARSCFLSRLFICVTLSLLRGSWRRWEGGRGGRRGREDEREGVLVEQWICEEKWLNVFFSWSSSSFWTRLDCDFEEGK